MATNCPTCGAVLDGRSICRRCGTLVALEFGVANIQGKAKSFLAARLAALPQRFRPHHFLWACAVMPLFIVPPLVSLVSSIASLRRPERNAAANDYEWIAIVSAINVILSGLVLYKFHFSVADVIDHIGDYLSAILHPVLPFIPDHTTRPTSI